MILRFLQKFQGSDVNIVSLGAGYDSTFFWLREHHADLSGKLAYREIDFSDIIKRKTEVIKADVKMSKHQ